MDTYPAIYQSLHFLQWTLFLLPPSGLYPQLSMDSTFTLLENSAPNLPMDSASNP